MLDRKDYPYFSYFMDMVPVFYDCIDDFDYKLSKSNEIFAEFAKLMMAEGRTEECTGLKADIIKLKEKNIDVSDMQIFITQTYNLKFRQKEIPIVFDRILEGLESCMINRKDYPYFSYFMDRVSVFYDRINVSNTQEIFAESSKMFKTEECTEICMGLKADIIKLKEINTDMQIFFIRANGLEYKQEEMPIVFDEILKGLES